MRGETISEQSSILREMSLKIKTLVLCYQKVLITSHHHSNVKARVLLTKTRKQQCATTNHAAVKSRLRVVFHHF